MHDHQYKSPQTDVLNKHFIVLFTNSHGVSVREWDSAEGDIWACAEYIKGNIAEYHESTKPQKTTGSERGLYGPACKMCPLCQTH